ncbi:MAG: DUF4153 domain-containing protein [Tabrizicola sp.]|nr:DUF4153 domain-containing protein [Tabrizicola sp.]
MTATLQQRWVLALIGAAGAAAFYGLLELTDNNVLSSGRAISLAAFICTFFGGILAAAGPIGLRKAALGALVIAAVTAGLVALKVWSRGDGDIFFEAPLTFLAAFTVATLPLPFLISWSGPGWRDYPTLFFEAWSITVRSAAAGAFTGLVWLVISLSDALFQLIGLEVISDLLDITIVPFLITGAVLGLAMAVVHEFADLLSPYLVLRLFRLLLPVVTAVMAVFLATLPFRDLDGLFQDFSPAMVLLTMVATGIALVSIAIDQTDEEATASPFLRAAAQVQALILPVMAGFAAWALWTRIDQYGLTPERIFISILAIFALGYGLFYALAVLRRTAWMARIRRTNLWMALAAIVTAALWLTPLLDAERISARNQLARFEAGQTPLDQLDIYQIGSWGAAGEAALAALEAKAKEPGQEALANRLAPDAAVPPSREALVAELIPLLPLQPPTATGTRDVLIGALVDYELADWIASCKRLQPDGRAGCVLVVADLLPDQPGEEGMIILYQGDRYYHVLGVYVQDARLAQREARRTDGSYLTTEDAEALLRAYQDGMPPLAPARLNQLGTDSRAITILP